MIPGKEDFYLTCGQRWLLHLLEQAPDLARPVQRIYRLSSAFDSSAFLEAIRCTISSHPALGLQLVQSQNGWRQWFPDQDVNVSGEEVQGRTPEMRAAYTSMLIAQEAKTTLDLRNEPPVKAKIIRVDGDHFLSLCVDHLAADEIAFDLFERELQLSYQQVMSGSTISAIPSDAFSNYLSKEFAQRNAEHNHLLYWQEQLKDVPISGDTNNDVLWVPAAIFDYQLSGPPFQGVLNFCRTHKCSLFTVIVATQLLLLADAGNIDDIVLNIPVSNRANVNERSIIANLSMLLHVRFFLIPNEPASLLVLRVRDRILNAMAHRQYDYPSLSRFIADKQNGFNTGWLRGCNYVADDVPVTFPNILFEERMDNLPGRSYDIPRTSFTVAVRQTGPNLRIVIDWDAAAWPIKSDDMETKFLMTLQKFQE